MYEEKVQQEEKVLIPMDRLRDALRKVKGARAELQLAYNSLEDALDKHLNSVHHARQ